MTPVWELANPQLRDLIVYEAGKPIAETARELGINAQEIIKLASNENPLGPSPKAAEAMRAALADVHLYPEGSGFYLREELGKRLGLKADNIILGNGSNEIIEFVCHAFLNRSDQVIAPRYSFIAYKIIATLFGADTIETAAPDFEQDLDAVADAITPKTRLVFLANPNNPTGSLISQRKIDSYMARVPTNIVTVFDEAYFEFLEDPPDALRYIHEGRNVVVLRTFSKIHGLAGLRVGYGIAPSELIGVLQKTREPFNVNSIAQVGALAALSDHDHLRESKRTVDEGRAFLQAQLTGLNRRWLPSAGNFIMVHVGDGAAVFKQMLAGKVIVRPLRGYGLAEWIRISVGTMEQNRKCIAALKEVLSTDRT
jgi:histidinol-phosphate aminotransferase